VGDRNGKPIWFDIAAMPEKVHSAARVVSMAGNSFSGISVHTQASARNGNRDCTPAILQPAAR